MHSSRLYYESNLPTKGLTSDNASRRNFTDDKIYGFIHIAKTGGTYVNEVLANAYQGVCGNKGSSLYYYRLNELIVANNTPNLSDARKEFFSVAPNNFIGFEECDYITMEDSFHFWNSTFPRGKLHGTPIELHVPCRRTIDHILSSCSWMSVSLDCNTSQNELFEIVEKKCLVHGDRYHHNLRQDFDVKCFDNDKTSEYVQYMSRRLQPRRFESKPFVYYRGRWGDRDKDSECIWSRPDLLQEMARHFLSGQMLSHHYYQYCNECLGSENDLAL